MDMAHMRKQEATSLASTSGHLAVSTGGPYSDSRASIEVLQCLILPTLRQIQLM